MRHHEDTALKRRSSTASEPLSRPDMGAGPPDRIEEAKLELVRCRVLPDGRMNRRDAAAYLGLKEKTLAMWALQGRGPRIVRISNRCFYFRTDIDEFIRNQGA